GDHIIQRFPLVVPADAPAGRHVLALGVYHADPPGRTVHPLDLRDGDGHELGAAGTVAGPTTAPAPPGPPRQPLVVTFADQIALDGYDVSQAAGAVSITLHWRAFGAPAHAYTAFVHLLDASGKLVAQHDGPPLAGR